MNLLLKIKLFFKDIYRKFVFWLSETNNPIYLGFFKLLYNPKPNSVSSFLLNLGKRKNVFVFQVGANDGITHDPIHKFIKMFDWSGILLEPQKFVYNKFLVQVYKKNRGIYPVNGAIGYQNGKADLFTLGFTNKRWATGLATFNKKELEDEINSGNIERRARKNGDKIPEDSNRWIVKQEVQTFTPSELINKYNVSEIDLLIVDAEGFDFEVIKMFDMDLIKPKAIVFERFHLNENDKKASIEYVERYGYKWKDIAANTLAWQPEFDSYII